MVHNKKEKLPENQYEVNYLPPLTIEQAIPKFNGKDWDLIFEGEIENPMKLSWDNFLKLERVKVKANFHCVTGWSKLDNNWEGVSSLKIAEIVKPKPTAEFVTIASVGFYTTSVPIEIFLDNDVLLADKLNGKPIPAENGGPIRMIIPKRWAWKSAKWVQKLIFTKEQQLGFWELRGYHNNADPFGPDEERFASPQENRKDINHYKRILKEKKDKKYFQ